MKPRYLVILGVLLAVIGLVWSVQNRQRAITMSQALLVKDQAGQDTRADISKLEEFIHGHMRTSISFELTGSYERAVTAAKAAAQPTVSGDVYTRAQAACPQKVATAQTKCIADFVASQAPGQSAKPVVLPNRDNFMRSFQAPGWTPDGAGLVFLASLASMAVAGWLVIANRLWPSHPSHR
jgi:hypothetical protein